MKNLTASRPWRALAGFLALTVLAGAIGSVATVRNVQAWYPGLQKPAWNPPNWIFAPMWSLLYILMAVAIWRVWRRPATGTSALVKLYFVQLALNALWSVVFFGLKQPAWALLDIVALWGLLVWLQGGFWRRDRLAAALWVPYVLWVSFATALNAAIVVLN